MTTRPATVVVVRSNLVLRVLAGLVLTLVLVFSLPRVLFYEGANAQNRPNLTRTLRAMLASVIPTPGLMGSASVRNASDASIAAFKGSGEALNQSKPFRLARERGRSGTPQSGTADPLVVASLNMTQSFPAAATTSALTLGSSTPYLPFLGNRLVLNSFVPNTTAAANVTVGYAVGLRRQPGCSLVEDIGHRHPPGPNTSEVATLPAAQDYLHQLSGLTTKPDVYPQGCNVAVYGIPTNNNVQLLGVTPAGAAIAATAFDGLQVILADPVTDKFSTTTLLSGNSINGSFAAADLNDDGKMDIVATFVTDPSTQQPSTAVFLGNGDGTFKPGVYYDVPGDITIDDVTGDGKPDIIVLTNPGVTTLVGKGDGTFTAGSVSATGRTFFGQAGGQVLTGDFNGDGKTDLIADGIVLLGEGDGSFTLGAPIDTDNSLNFTSSIPAIAVGSLRNNGKLDAVVSQPGFAAIYYGKGDGTFTLGPRYAALPDLEQVSITDIDGDGNPDIVLGTATDGIYADGGYDIAPELFQVIFGRGDGTFVDSPVYKLGDFSSLRITALTSGKFTASGKTDVLAANFGPNGPSSLLVLPGDGTGNLGNAISTSLNIAPLLVAVSQPTQQVVVAGNNGGPMVAVLNIHGDGTFTGEQDYTIPNAPVSLAIGDFNGDGEMDVAVGVASTSGGSAGVYFMLGQSNGTLGSPVPIDSSILPTGLAAGDLNGDGRTDLIVADQGTFNFVGSPQQVNGALHIYLGKSDGTFTSVTAPTTTATNYSVTALGDLNKDGKLDLIVAGNVAGTTAGFGTPMVYTLIGKGDGTFDTATSTSLSGTDGIGPTTIALADFNNDGHLDAVVGNPNDFTEFLLGDGTGAMTDSILALGQRPDVGFGVADLTGNGFPSLLEDVQGTANNFAVFLNSNSWATVTPPASGTTATTTTLTSSTNPSAVGQAVTFTAKVAATSGTGSPTGTVTFLDNGTSIGSGALSSGTATLKTSSLSQGSHPITAQYSGDSTFAMSTSSPLTQIVNVQASFSMSAPSSTSVTVQAGKSSGSITFTLTPQNGSTQTVTFACSGLPAQSNCQFTPQSVVLDGTHTSAPVSVSIMTTASSMLAPERLSRRFVRPFMQLLTLLAVVLSIVTFNLLRFERFRVAQAAFAGVTLLALTLLAACGGGSSSTTGGGGSVGTPAGTSTVTITATGVPGNTTATTTVSLTVTN